MLVDPRNRYTDALEQLAPLIAEHRAAFDRDRRVSDVVFRALAEAGLFRLWLPVAFGGPELSPTEFMHVVEAASALDGSVGWLVANGGGMSRVAGYLPQGVAAEWFADPYAFVVAATGAVGQAQPVSGGYRVTGRLPFGSGSSHAIAAEAGSGAIFEGSHLERANRDLQAAVRHVAMTPRSYVAAGRPSLGLDAGDFRF